LHKDIIADSLGVTPIQKQEVEVVAVDHIEDDYDFARKNLKDLIYRGTQALDNIMDVADQSESPRAYEVVSNLFGQLTDANKKLLELAAQKKKLQDVKSDEPKTVNNNLFVGSSTDLLKMIKNQANETQ
jgi:hypothetical protein